MKEKKNKKRKKINYIEFRFSEEFITSLENATKEDLKNIFNKKYFNYIKRIEARKSGYVIWLTIFLLKQFYI